MGTFSITTAKNAKGRGETRFESAKFASVFYGQVVDIIRRAWPRKTSSHIAYLTGVSERSVQFWLAGETRMSVENVAALLRTDAGFEILKAIMGEAKPKWWLNFQIVQSVRESKRAIAREMKRTEELRALQAQIELFEEQ